MEMGRKEVLQLWKHLRRTPRVELDGEVSDS